MEKMPVKGIAGDSDTARIAIVGLKNEPGVAFKLFKSLAKRNINIDMILQSVGRNGTKDISFTTSEDNVDEAAKVIHENFNNYESIDVEKKVVKISVEGTGNQINTGVAAKMFEALYDANINIKMISTLENRVTVLVDEMNSDRAIEAVNEKFEIEK